MAVHFRNIDTDYRIIGVFSSAANFLTNRNDTAAAEGDVYYDTTLDQLRTYNGSAWSPAGMTGIGAGSLDAAANLGTKITIDGAMTTGIEIEATDAIISTNGQLLLLDNNDTGSDVHALEITNAGTAPSIIITGQSSSDDIQGTSDNWAIDSAGLATFGGGVDLLDDDNLRFGSSQDVVIDWDQTQLLIAAAADDTKIEIGDSAATQLSFDIQWYGNGANGADYLYFDASANLIYSTGVDLQIKDSDFLVFGSGAGASGDVNVKWDTTNLLIEAATDNTGQIRLGSTNAMDLSVYGSTNTNICLFDVNETTYGSLLDLNGWDIRLQDDDQLMFGDASDVVIDWDQTKLVIACDDGRVDLGVSGAGFDMYWYTEDATNYVYWDEDNSRMDMIDVDLRLDDDARLYFGSDADVYLNYDNTNAELDVVGDVNITGTLTISGAFDLGHFSFADDEELRFGNSNDFVFHYDASAANLLIDAAAANDIIDFGSSVNTDIILHGGTATYDVHWDSSEDTLCFLDDAVLAFGNTAASPDVEFKWDQTRLNITGTGLQIRIGSDDEGMDVLFYGETASAQMLWDESADQLVVGDSGASIDLQDDVKLLLGTGTSNAGDFSIHSDGSNIFIREIASAGKGIEIGVDNKGLDVKFFGETSGADMEWDQSEDALTFEDAAYIKLGTGNDLLMSATTTTATFKLAAASDLKILDTDNTASKVTFGLTGGTHGLDVQFNTVTSGEDMIFDAAGKTFKLDNVDLWLQDDDILSFGDASDVTITWDQTDLLIESAAEDTGEIKVGSTNAIDLALYGNTATKIAKFNANTATLEFVDYDVQLQDDCILALGTGDDITLMWDQSRLIVDGAAADKEIRIGATNNQDIMIYGDTSTDLVTFDTSAEDVQFNGFDLTLQDDDILNFGDADDVQIFWDQTQLQIDGGSIFIGDQTNYVTINATGDITCTLNTTTFSSLVLPTHASSSPDGSKSGTTGAIFYEQDASVLWVCASGTTWLSTAALS